MIISRRKETGVGVGGRVGCRGPRQGTNKKNRQKKATLSSVAGGGGSERGASESEARLPTRAGRERDGVTTGEPDLGNSFLRPPPSASPPLAHPFPCVRASLSGLLSAHSTIQPPPPPAPAVVEGDGRQLHRAVRKAAPVPAHETLLRTLGKPPCAQRYSTVFGAL